jgi:hypothetical protein
MAKHRYPALDRISISVRGPLECNRHCSVIKYSALFSVIRTISSQGSSSWAVSDAVGAWLTNTVPVWGAGSRIRLLVRRPWLL